MWLFKNLLAQIYAFTTLFVLVINSVLCFIPIALIGFFKLLPCQSWRSLCTLAIDKAVTFWCSVNNLYIDNVQKIKLDMTGLEHLELKNWYLVVANHQSWLDVVILQRIFNRKIPVLKFFIKDQLKWVPLFGFAWWAMGCLFMKRYSKEYLAKKPHKKGSDFLSTRKAMKVFKRTPVSMVNFIEGTRFTSHKKHQQQSPYLHLLIPKAGGISLIISSMGEQIKSLLDVSIVYAEKKHSFWDFLCKKVNSAKIVVRQIPIPSQFISHQLPENKQLYAEFKEWLNQQWAEKDKLITSLISP